MKSFFCLIIFCISSFAQAGELGSWSTSCADLGDDSILISKLKIRGGRWELLHTAFEDDKCKTPWLKHQLTYKVIQRDHDIDMTLVQATYEALSKETVEALNLVAYCGFSDWKVATPKSVIGRECQDYRVPVQGQILYSSFMMVNENGKPGIKLGVAKGTLDGSTPEKRFQDFSNQIFFKD